MKRKAVIMIRLVVAFSLLTASALLAIPPSPDMLDGRDGSGFDPLSYFSSYRDARSRGVDMANPIYGPENPPFGSEGAMSGTDAEMNVLILLVDFSDNASQTSAVYFDSMGYADDTLSLRDYYGQVSFGQIDIVTVDYPSATGWQRAPETYEYYV
ncbi:MAG: hypothetical protein GF388_11825, partial [Candidatus Aegiribacteria sp.]|nr:hypothetical protein [Candidatus Aegiribacteria sp.]MBD3295656.1 hypothetical protein [Candidatus Fermentibacteria bacterium]